MTVFTNINEQNLIITPESTISQHGWLSNNGQPVGNEISTGDFMSMISGSELPKTKITESIVMNVWGTTTKVVNVNRSYGGEFVVLKMPTR